MPASQLPLILEPDVLQPHLGSEHLRVVDLSKPETYAQFHIPGARHLDYSQIVAVRPPVAGLLPDEAHLNQVLSSVGITPDTHVVAYDDEGGGRAARLLWTLDVSGHARFSLLNGGLHAWANEGYPLDHRPVETTRGDFQATRRADGIAERDYILTRLGDSSTALLDCRSPDEYWGVKRLAERAGHIPGAVNLEWTQAMDTTRNLRLKPDAELRRQLEALGVTPDKEVIAYCQTHHRSAYSYIVLKSLGYPRVKGYPGSWSEWGNSADTPVE
ncbi:MAG: sulfurtransferase [Gammaproteobacteria bacterium]|nr:sulfurtransferase [Gammaproteobacteria bacterium]